MQFDNVHVGSVVLVVQEDHALPLLENLLTLLSTPIHAWN